MASIETQLKLFGLFASSILILWGFLRWVVKMQPRTQVFEILKVNKADFDELLFDALDRNQRNRDTFRSYTERVFVDIIAQNVKPRDMAEANSDRLEYVEASLTRVQNDAMDKLTSAMNNSTRAGDHIAQTMKEMQKEIQRISDEQIRLAAFVQWDGRERRRNKPPG